MKTISFLSNAIEGYIKYRKASGRYSYSSVSYTHLDVYKRQPRQRSEGRPVQREPHAGGSEQRGQDQRGDEGTERAVAEGTDRPEEHDRHRADAAQEARRDEALGQRRAALMPVNVRLDPGAEAVDRAVDVQQLSLIHI